MKGIPPFLNFEEMSERISYNPKTGILKWKINHYRIRKGDVVGSWDKFGYLTVRVCQRSYKVHRVAWLLHHGEWPSKNIDHINGNCSDNRIQNLREADQGQNLANARTPHDNRSGYKNVQWSKQAGKWKVIIQRSGRVHYLGLFDDVHEAGKVAREFREKNDGEFVCHGSKKTPQTTCRSKIVEWPWPKRCVAQGIRYPGSKKKA